MFRRNSKRNKVNDYDLYRSLKLMMSMFTLHISWYVFLRKNESKWRGLHKFTKGWRGPPSSKVLNTKVWMPEKKIKNIQLKEKENHKLIWSKIKNKIVGFKGKIFCWFRNICYYHCCHNHNNHDSHFYIQLFPCSHLLDDSFFRNYYNSKALLVAYLYLFFKKIICFYLTDVCMNVAKLLSYGNIIYICKVNVFSTTMTELCHNLIIAPAFEWTKECCALLLSNNMKVVLSLNLWS